ncbi:MAG: 5'/3'-nucleotidase SurE [Nitrospirota bacterium]|nr:5'/3'-nucleotidase SurE [Nitrospirota bacterium]
MSVILVANDDGIHSPGITALFRAMKELGDAYIIAPDRERSAASHSLTLHKPLKVEKINEYTYSINGTPTDCVILGVNKLLPEKPALVVSGINKGGNLGDDITYSGTVSAAIEGTIMGIPSFAISLFIEEEHASPLHFDTASDFAVKIGRYILEKSLPHNTLLNINVPNVPKNKILGVKFTRQGKMFYNNSIKDIIDPKGKKHYWIGGSQPYIKHGDNTDIQAIHEGYISITPVNIDLTNYKALEFLKNELSFLS